MLSAPAWAQYGLYGSPDPLQVPTARPTYGQANGYTPTNSYAPAGGSTPAYAYPSTTGSAPNYAAPPSYTPQAVASRPMPAYVSPNPPYQAMYPNQAVPPNQNTAAAAPVMPSSPLPAPPAIVAQPATPAPSSNGAAPAAPGDVKQGQNVMSQLLTEQRQAGGQNGSAGGYVPYGCQTPNCATGGDPGCGTFAGSFAEIGGCCPWYGSVSALVMTRDEPNKLWTSSDSLVESIQTMNTQECRSSWKWGGEIRFGRRFCCGNPCESGYDPTSYWAVEASYWTLDRFHGYHEVGPYDPSNPLDRVNTPLRVSDVHFFTTLPATVWFNGAAQHWLERYNEIHNVELAFIGGRWATAYGSPWDFAWSVGPRFFRFQESLTFGTVQWGYVKAADTYNAYISDEIVNTLIGCQIGCDLGYNVNSSLRLYAAPKAGVYGNQMTNRFRIALGDGTAPTDFPAEIRSAQNCTSFLMQIDLGAEWFFARSWSLRAGYRALAISGIGLADNQIPWAMPEALEENISYNGELVLHGGYLSVTYNF
ncbi:MAG: hypothetical protein JXB10_09800 [Pirellulales bacterium]|nr:hypothetical protein [Pirellulales bacterium]